MLVLVGAQGAGAQTLPVADAGSDQQLDCAPPEGAVVTLDGSGSTDPDDATAVLTYTWAGDVLGAGVTLDGVNPTFSAPPGTHPISLTVDDGVDGTSVDEVIITVVADSVPPVLTLTGSGAELWPPNHKYHPFTAVEFVMDVSDDCDEELSPADVVFEQVASDEEENGRGDGNTSLDVLLAYGCTDALIRSERQGPGDGRVYEATLAVADAAGNAATGTVAITVPKSRGQGPAIDSGDLYVVDSESCAVVELCPAEPDPACIPSAGKARLSIRDGKRARLSWKARAFAAGESDLGDGSTGTDYQVCVYLEEAGTAEVVSTPAAPAGDGWKTRSRGQSYRMKGMRAGGLNKVRIRSGATETSVAIGGKSADLDVPDLPIADEGAFIVQLHASDGTCLETRFEDPHVNRPGKYRARSN
ncbi:MAG: hypothetical protein ACR2PQ_07120 [Myxococcota bacterium]